VRQVEIGGTAMANCIPFGEDVASAGATVAVRAGSTGEVPRRQIRRQGDRHARRLEEEAAWIERYHQLWVARFDELDRVVEELKRKEKTDGRNKRR
jgi:hypothetical protein